MQASTAYKSAFLLTVCLACSIRPFPGDSATDATASVGETTGAGESTGETAPTTAAPTTTGPSTTGPSTATATTTPPVTSEPATTGCGFVCADFTDPPSMNDCDPWLMPKQDCPDGQKCTIEDMVSDTHCVDIVPAPKGMYEPCKILMGNELSGFDDCGAGLLCWNVDPNTGVGECIGICQGPIDKPSCVDPGAKCLLCQDCALGLCIPNCDPLLQDCDDGNVCIPDSQGTGFTCALDASGDEGQVFDPCEFVNVCDPGLVCVDPVLAKECDPQGNGCCLPFCDLVAPLNCPGVGQTCLAWFEAGNAPPGLENVGVCGVEP